MSERKTRGRQRIPIKLIENKDDLLVSFSKRRVGVYRKASELSTLCGVDVGAIIFSPSGIPHSFFTSDFASVVYGRHSTGESQDGYGRAVEDSSRIKIRELNQLLDKVVEEQEREEGRENEHGGRAAAEMGWWEVPVDSLSVEEVKEQIEWFHTLKAQIKNRVEELKSGGDPRPPENGECFFVPPSMEGYDGGCGSNHAGDHYIFPPPPPYFDVGGGSGCSDQYIFPPALPCGGGGGGGDVIPAGQYCFQPPSLNLFGGDGIGHEEQYFFPPSPDHGGDPKL